MAEHDHPILNTPDSEGRPLQLDFAVNNDGDITLVVETKWANEKGVKVASVLWDCVRLELAANHYNCNAFFILASTREHVDNMLASAPMDTTNTKGKNISVLRIDGKGRHSVNVHSPKRDFGPQLHAIMEKYEHVKYPRSFVCSNGAMIPAAPKASQYTAAVWHISPENMQKRITFSVPVKR